MGIETFGMAFFYSCSGKMKVMELINKIIILLINQIYHLNPFYNLLTEKSSVVLMNFGI